MTYQAETAHFSLGDGFFTPVEPSSFPEATLRFRNQRAAATVGLGHLNDDAWIAHFGRFEPLPDNLQQPLALHYHGHQFRTYNPDIGDGRGFLFAQLRDEQGRLLDLGTKGSGQTPFSRFGDGRLTLKGAVRELLATELLHARGVNTSETFSIIETGESLERQDEPSPTRSAVLVRLSHSHIRFGTFQYLAFHKRHAEIKKLIDYAVTHYFPDLSETDGDERLLAFYKHAIESAARTAAQWMAAGFVHGVLNTDNMNITGESFDYGPWRFLPYMDPAFTAAYFDQTGLYAYGRQPEAVAWNLAQLGGTLVPVFGDDGIVEEKLNQALTQYSGLFAAAMRESFARRFGIRSMDDDTLTALMLFLREYKLSLEQVMFDWYGGEQSSARAEKSPYKSYYQQLGWQPIKDVLIRTAPLKSNAVAHPYFSRERPVDMVIEQMEALWVPIAEKDDWKPLFSTLNDLAEAAEAQQ